MKLQRKSHWKILEKIRKRGDTWCQVSHVDYYFFINLFSSLGDHVLSVLSQRKGDKEAKQFLEESVVLLLMLLVAAVDTGCFFSLFLTSSFVLHDVYFVCNCVCMWAVWWMCVACVWWCVVCVVCVKNKTGNRSVICHSSSRVGETFQDECKRAVITK